jgi:Domain of unknown function (DUF4824)
MRFAWSKTHTLIAAATLVLVSNAIALGGVAYNRSGGPESVLQLTEREVPIQFWSWPDNENSAVHLQLFWRVSGGVHDWDREAQWLTTEQLRQLGFALPPSGALDEELRRFSRQPSREAFFALENSGPAYRTALQAAREALSKAETELAMARSNETLTARAKVAREELKQEEETASRLFVVAVDVDPGALRKRYPDRKQYAIVSGRVSLRADSTKVVAQIDDINTSVIRVPYAYRGVVEPLLGERTYYGQGAPRYAATVQFGRRLEPWIVRLELTKPLATAAP